MRPVQMVDTKTQYQKIKAEVDSAVLQGNGKFCIYQWKTGTGFCS